AHVTMLQRSPSYVVSLPAEDRLANWLRRRLPARVAYSITRWKNVLFGIAFYSFCRRFPKHARRLILAGVRARLGRDFDVEKHFSPAYDPWDQRLCLVPNSDFFAAIRSGRASVVTDHIERFTSSGIRLRSGAELEADLVVTATGLKLRVLNGVDILVDGEKIDPSDAVTYKGMMLSDVPNLAFSIGYTNASWTLKSDLACQYVCRLLDHMAKHGHRVCCARNVDPTLEREPLIDFSSGYVLRSVRELPKQGSRSPWKLHQNYLLDRLALGYGPVADEAMQFS
ncbi:MAG: FAD-containing monooxygenase EthA, partial [Candidatus Binatia bacterium]